jgi:DNA-binding NtrC family response regulator
LRTDRAARTAAANPERVLVRGEVGSGKRTIATAIHSIVTDGPLAEVDAAGVVLDGVATWSAKLRDLLAPPRAMVVINHIERLGPEAAGVVTTFLDGLCEGQRVIATATTSGDPLAPWEQALADRLGQAVVDTPPLRDRIEDLPEIVAAITRSIVGRDGTVTWSPHALQALSRLSWPGNLRELGALVRRVLAHRSVGVVTPDDLPEDVRARAHRYSLTQMERAEVEVIVSALAEAGGNKAEAAAALGISRSTLYRKLRGYGLDLDRTIY